MICREVYMRHTDTDGATWVREHRVWDGDLFVASQQSAAQELNAAVKDDGKRLAKAEQITREQYLANR
jgi:hypothetical protein